MAKVKAQSMLIRASVTPSAMPTDRTLSLFIGFLLSFRVLLEPFLHCGDFGLLSRDDLIGPGLDLIILAELQDRTGHIDRALMVRNHRLDEGDIGIAGLDALHHRPVHSLHGLHIGLGGSGMLAVSIGMSCIMPPCIMPPCIIFSIMGAIFSIMGIIFCIMDIIAVHCSGISGIASAAGAAVAACGASAAGWC